MGILQEKMSRDMSVRNFAANTIESYLRSVRYLAKYYMISPDRLSQEQLLDYIYFLIKERKLAPGSVNAVTAGLRFFYKETMGMKDMALTIPPRKTARKLPEIFNADELSRLFSMLQTYSPGKHRGEKNFEKNGVNYIDDSKGTNPAAVIAAIQSISGANKSIRLILQRNGFCPFKRLFRTYQKSIYTWRMS